MPRYWSPFCTTSSHLSYMLAFSWQNTLVAGMTGISCLRQDIIELPLEGAKGPQFFSTSWLGNSMILLWCFKCSHSAWTALRVYALCWITPMASPVVSSERKIHQLTDTDDLEKKIGFVPWFLNCSTLLALMLRGSRGGGRSGAGHCRH